MTDPEDIVFFGKPKSSRPVLIRIVGRRKAEFLPDPEEHCDCPWHPDCLCASCDECTENG